MNKIKSWKDFVSENTHSKLVISRVKSKNWVENNFNTHLEFILKTIGYKMKKGLDSQGLIDELEKVKEMAIKYFTKFPEKIPGEVELNFIQTNVGSIIPVTNNIGGVFRDKTYFK
jgi:hypothetical protein